MRRWLLITVSEASAGARQNLRALTASIDRQGATGDVVVVSRGDDGSLPSAPAGFRLHVVEAPLRIGLSAARNLGLEHAERAGLLDRSDFVAFPDDDGRYAEASLERVEALLRECGSIVCGPYAPSAAQVDRKRFPSERRPLTPGLIMRVSSSATVFFEADVVRALGRFDERFGLGARYGSAEDSDYALRALVAGFSGVYAPALLVEHAYKARRPLQYYAGNVAVLAKHAARGGTILLLARRLASGALLTLRRRLSISEYAAVVSSAARLIRTH